MQAFQGAAQDLETNPAIWVDGSKQFRAGLVAAENVPADPDWIFLSEFLASNPFVPTAATPPVTSRTIESWNAANNRVNFNFGDQPSFGAIGQGVAYAGVLIYRNVNDDPSTSPIWFYNNSAPLIPGVGSGGEIQYGTEGGAPYLAGYLAAVAGSAIPLAGAAYDIREGVSLWVSSDTFRLRLVSGAGVTVGDSDWVTLEDMTNAGVVWVPGAPDVTIQQAARSRGYDPAADQWTFDADPVLPHTFANVPSGHNCVAVVLFRDTGNPASSRVWHWDGAFASFLSTGGDVVYGSGLQEIIQRIVL